MVLSIAALLFSVLSAFAEDIHVFAAVSRSEARAEERLERTNDIRRLAILRRKLRHLNRSKARPVTETAQKRTVDTALVLDTIRTRVIALVNEQRAKAGLHPVRENTMLDSSAQGHAEDMLRRSFFAHENPDGLNSFARIKAAGYVVAPCACSWRYYTGENIARGQHSAEEALQDWMESEKHKENILNPHYDEIGVGFIDNHWVQNFGKIEP